MENATASPGRIRQPGRLPLTLAGHIRPLGGLPERKFFFFFFRRALCHHPVVTEKNAVVTTIQFFFFYITINFCFCEHGN